MIAYYNATLIGFLPLSLLHASLTSFWAAKLSEVTVGNPLSVFKIKIESELKKLYMNHPGVKLAIARYSRTAINKNASETQKPLLITSIHIDSGGLTSLPRLSFFPAATKLQASHNKITEILDNWNDKIEDVDLSDNQLTSFPEIGGVMLMSLNLSENALRNITIPRQLPHLMELNLSIQCEKQAAPTDSGGFCSVFSDSFSQSLFDNCPQLQSINISMTGITSLSCLERCDSLRQIICLKNPIENLQDVLPFLHDRLIYLDLSDCPVTKDRRLFEAVCAKCPDLSFFNSKRYTEQQVKFTGSKYLREQKRRDISSKDQARKS